MAAATVGGNIFFATAILVIGGIVKNRVRELRFVRASELVENDNNFRFHPFEQQSAMRFALDEVGFSGAVIAREGEDGKLHLIDGHLRRSISGDEEIPVLVVDLSDDEANKSALLHDKISSMAEIDGNLLEKSLSMVDEDFLSGNAAVRKMFSEIGLDSADDDSLAVDLDRRFNHAIPEMNLRPHEGYDYLVVLSENRNDWNRLCDLLGLEAATFLTGRHTKKTLSKNRKTKIGISRAILANKLIEMLDNGNENRCPKPRAPEKHGKNTEPSPERSGGSREKRGKQIP